jgi:hypothetical protein
VKVRALVTVIALAACTGEQPDSLDHRPSTVRGRLTGDPSKSQRTVVLVGGNDSICDVPNGSMPNAAELGHWFADDARSRRKTFGMRPPDSASVKLVGDSTLARQVSDVIDSALFRMSGKKIENAPRDREKVYRAGRLYAVVDLDQKFCGSDRTPLPIIFFVDTAWRFLGTRSN